MLTLHVDARPSFPHHKVRNLHGVETVTRYYILNGQRIAGKWEPAR